jgi:hypothetical protein
MAQRVLTYRMRLDLQVPLVRSSELCWKMKCFTFRQCLRLNSGLTSHQDKEREEECPQSPINFSLSF